jgi:hypothetical protein
VRPLRAVALNVLFCPLNGPDDISLFHPVCIYVHGLGHLSDRVEVHFFPAEPYG